MTNIQTGKAYRMGNCLAAAVLLWMFLTGVTAASANDAYGYILPDSSWSYLTSEEIADMPLQVVCYAKNEIYARHGRMFVTERIAEYFNSKSWYQGTIDPQTFDAQQSSIFNETELANIQKILQWEEKKRNEGH